MNSKTLPLIIFLLFSVPARAQYSNNVVVSPSVGQPATASADYATAIGNNTVAGVFQSDGSNALLIQPTWSYTRQTAIGNNSLAWGQGDTAIGNGAVSVSQPSLGQTSSSVAIGNAAGSWGNNNVSLGYSAKAGAGVGAPTSNPTINNATALGGQSSAQANNSTAIGANAYAGASNSVALGAGSTATRANTVEVGYRQISGVAAGTQTTDAVNLGQLQAAIAGISPSSVDTGAILNQANNYTDQAVASVRREMSRGIAAVAAAPALPALAPGEKAIAVGTGFYNGQTAIGVSFARATSSGTLLNGGMSSAGGKPVVRAGSAWKF